LIAKGAESLDVHEVARRPGGDVARDLALVCGSDVNLGHDSRNKRLYQERQHIGIEVRIDLHTAANDG